MKTYHVGGFYLFNRFKTLAEALKVANDDDTIELHKDISECVTIVKNIIIKGNNKKWIVPQGKAGIQLQQPIELYDIGFVLSPRSNVILTTHNLTLGNVSIKLLGPIRQFYSSIIVEQGENQPSPVVEIMDSKLTKLTLTSDVSGTITNTQFYSYYDGTIMLSGREDMSTISGNVDLIDCQLKSIILAGTHKLTACTLDKYVEMDGNVIVDSPVLSVVDEVVKPNQYKNEPKNGPLKGDTNSKYVVAVRGGNVHIINYDIESLPSSFVGIYATHAKLLVEDSTVGYHDTRHLIVDSTISYKNVTDETFWDLDNTTSAFVRSTVNSNSSHVPAHEKLNQLIGQDEVKRQVTSIMNTIRMGNETNSKDFDFSYNMVFAGSPGTGKTTIARIVAEALFEIGAIPENKFTEAGAEKFIKGYVGQSGANTERIMESALGGVLFIDEAYQLTVKEGQNSFNSDVLTVILRYMENHRKDLVVIAAGYNEEMKQFLASNIGLSRRFQWIQFEDYTNQEMTNIFEMIRTSYGDEYEQPENANLILPLFDRLTTLNLSIPDTNGHVTNGGNGGLVRNVYQQITQARNNRVMETGGTKAFTRTDIATGFKTEMNSALRRRPSGM